jgi:hypothetical protein
MVYCSLMASSVPSPCSSQYSPRVMYELNGGVRFEAKKLIPTLGRF